LKKFDARPETATGFTLLEVITALSVLSIVLVSVYKLQGQTILMGSSAKFNAEAPMLANRILSEFDSGFKEKRLQEEDGGVFEEPFEEYQWRISLLRPQSELLEEVAKDVVKLDIEIKRIEDEQTFTLTAYRLLRW
jgi:general secretion pathway protein I